MMCTYNFQLTSLGPDCQSVGCGLSSIKCPGLTQTSIMVTVAQGQSSDPRVCDKSQTAAADKSRYPWAKILNLKLSEDL